MTEEQIATFQAAIAEVAAVADAQAYAAADASLNAELIGMQAALDLATAATQLAEA